MLFNIYTLIKLISCGLAVSISSHVNNYNKYFLNINIVEHFLVRKDSHLSLLSVMYVYNIYLGEAAIYY